MAEIKPCRMRLAAVIGEAWRNLASGTTRAAAWAVVATVVAGGLAAADVTAICGLERRAEAFRAAGAATFRLSAPKAVDAERCHNLATLPNVTGAGAVRDAGEITDLAMPGSAVPARQVTSGLAGVLNVNPLFGPGVLVTDSVAASLGLEQGDHLVTNDGSVQVVAVYRYPEDGRIRELGYSVLQPVPPTGRFDACWVSVWPIDESVLPVLRATVDSDQPDVQAEVTQVNQSHGRTFDGLREFDRRPTGLGWAIGAVIDLVIGFASVWARRLELAATLHAGVPKLAVVTSSLLEASFWTITASLLAGSFSWLLSAACLPADPIPAVLAAARIIVSTTGAAMLGAGIAALATRERRLFRYFKAR